MTLVNLKGEVCPFVKTELWLSYLPVPGNLSGSAGLSVRRERCSLLTGVISDYNVSDYNTIALARRYVRFHSETRGTRGYLLEESLV